MRISTKGRYAMCVMIDLAEHYKEGPVALKDIAARQNISKKYLEQIVSLLNRPDFLKTIRGAQGGYMLARTPDKYTVAEILKLSEGSLAPVTCLEYEENDCPRAHDCYTLYIWEGLYKTVNDYLDSISVQDILIRSAGGSDYCI